MGNPITSLIPMALVAAALLLPQPLPAQERDNTTLTRLDTDNPEAFAFFDALGVYDFLEIVAEESVMGADQIRLEFFPNVAPEIWESEMRGLFSPEILIAGFEAAWDDDALDAEARAPIMAFYSSELGRQIVMAEIAARAGMSDPDIAEAAETAVLMAERDGDARLERHADFAAALGLVDRNVSAMMNAQLQFLTGLSDAGALQPQMPEDDVLRFIAAQAGELQAEAESWLAAYHLMAYGALETADFEAFVAINTSPEGRALTTAVFAAFDTTFDALQYQLGVVGADYAIGDDI